MASFFIKVQRLIGYLQQNYAFGGAVRDLWRLLVPAGGGAMSAWYASATAWLDEWGPIAWVGAFFVGALLTTLILLVAATLRLQWERAKYTNSLSKRTVTANPLDQVFEKKRIELRDFHTYPPKVYEGKTFIDCDFIGPVNVYLLGKTNFDDAKMTGATEFIKVKTTAKVPNAIHLKEMTIRRCTFYNVTVLVQENTTGKEAFSGDLNWLTDPI